MYINEFNVILNIITFQEAQFYTSNENSDIGTKRNYRSQGMENDKQKSHMMPCPKRKRLA